MEVLIDQAGHQHLVDEPVVDHMIGPDRLGDLGERADRDDAVTVDRHCVGQRPVGVDGADRGAIDDNIHDLTRRGSP